MSEERVRAVPRSLRTAVRAFGRDYNQHWLIERHDYLTPTEARDHLHARAIAAA